jgi:hypothetical protein
MGKVAQLKHIVLRKKFLECLSIKVELCTCGEHSVITSCATIGVRHMVWSITDEYLIHDSGWLYEKDKRFVRVLECSL